MKNKIATIGIIIATIILAGVAIFTAIRLYQLRQESITPIKPTSRPEAAVCEQPTVCTALTFTLGKTPTPTPTGQCEPVTGAYWCSNAGKTVLAVDHDVTNWSGCLSWCNSNMSASAPICQYNADGPRNCWVKEAPIGGVASCIWLPRNPYGSCYQGTPTPTPTGKATPTPTGSATPTVTPTITPTATPTTPPGATATPTTPPGAGATATPGEAQAALPAAGVSLPTIFGIGLGALLIIGALILAL